ncbi:MAG: PD-(D/E)XK nuclease family protein [Akkermansiaceae bacterium]
MTEAVPERVFLGWDKPLVHAVRDWLLSDAEALAETLVIVPTSNSGRRLRLLLSAEGGGVLSPHVLPPSRLFEVEGAATHTQQLWAWVRAVQSIEPGDFPNLLPNHASGSLKSFRTALAVGRQMGNLRDSLADADKGFQEALAVSPEKDRWLELCKLETKMLEVLKSWKLRDTVRAKRERSSAPELPVGVTRIVVAGVPDPTLLALNALQAHQSMGVPVTVLISAAETEKDYFDIWGVPDVDAWSEKQISFPSWRERLHVVNSASEAADLAVQLFSGNETPSEDAALALCDTSFANSLERSFGGSGWPLYDPDGKPAVDTGIARLIRCCAELMRNDRPFDAARELIRVPGAEIFLPKNTSRKWAAQLMDKLHHEHLPETLADARFLASEKEREILDSLTGKLDEASSDNIIAWIVQWLETTDKDLARQLEPSLAEVVDAMQQMELQGENFTHQETMEMLLVSIGGASLNAEQGDEVLDMQGWLEISYDPASHLVLAGMHEGCVPDGAVDDAFVPDSLKQELGMRDAAGRCARDAFLLTAAIQCRANSGRVDAIVARFNDAGEARKPSRLLLRYQGEELAHVVNHLFKESDVSESTAGAWRRDWMLAFSEIENGYLADPPRSLSPSAIKDYLNCPLRFYLKRVVKMDSFDADKREMDALDFGNLCHAVLEVFGNDSSIRDSVDADEIADYLSEVLERRIEKTYGNKVNLPLMVQMESARERLRVFAEKQAIERADGWRIVQTEFRVGEKYDVPWQIDGHPISMIIDRIDFHEETNQWRVWDYKTTGKAKTPEEQHLKSWKESENRPQLGELYSPAPRGRSERRWADVQLPIYAAFVRDHFQTDELPGIGYINLPRAITDTAFTPWQKFDENTLDHALAWAKSAIGGIRSENYQQAAVYPAGERDWDDFQELAPDGLAAAFGLNDS